MCLDRIFNTKTVAANPESLAALLGDFSILLGTNGYKEYNKMVRVLDRFPGSLWKMYEEEDLVSLFGEPILRAYMTLVYRLWIEPHHNASDAPYVQETTLNLRSRILPPSVPPFPESTLQPIATIVTQLDYDKEIEVVDLSSNSLTSSDASVILEVLDIPTRYPNCQLIRLANNRLEDEPKTTGTIWVDVRQNPMVTLPIQFDPMQHLIWIPYHQLCKGPWRKCVSEEMAEQVRLSHMKFYSTYPF
jgi:hypothetical protein